MLSPTERARWAAYRLADDARRHLLGALTVRALAGARTGVRPAELVVDRTCGRCALPHGRPVVPGVALSVSHSGALVAVAVGPGGARVGVDVELVRRDAPVDDLAAQVLTTAETAGLARLEPGPRRLRFFELWTVREAALKATGDGLRTDPRRVVVDRGTAAVPGHPPLALHPLAAPAPGHAATLATDPGALVTTRTVTALGVEGLTAN